MASCFGPRPSVLIEALIFTRREAKIILSEIKFVVQIFLTFGIVYYYYIISMNAIKR